MSLQKLTRSESTNVNDSQEKRLRSLEPCSSVHLDIFENENLVTEQVYNLSFNEDNNSQSVSPVLSEYEEDDDAGRRKKTSKCWDYFQLKKLKKDFIGKSNEKGEILPNRIVKCIVKTSNEICNLEFAHNDNSTGTMIRHLDNKHGIKLSQKIENNQREKDPSYLLLMFIITASLPFRCVDNQFFKLFCNYLNPNFKLPTRKTFRNYQVFISINKKSSL